LARGGCLVWWFGGVSVGGVGLAVYPETPAPGYVLAECAADDGTEATGYAPGHAEDAVVFASLTGRRSGPV
jgi:hypothetical protein